MPVFHICQKIPDTPSHTGEFLGLPALSEYLLKDDSLREYRDKMLGALRVRSLYARVDRKQAAFIKRVLAGTGLNREVIMEIKDGGERRQGKRNVEKG